MKFDQKIRFLADFEKIFKKSLYRYLWKISIFDQNLRAKSREITGSPRLRGSKNVSKCIFWSFWRVWNMIYQIRKSGYHEKANCHPSLRGGVILHHHRYKGSASKTYPKLYFKTPCANDMIKY